MYFIILATGATLFQAGKSHVQSATDAAEALRLLAGNAATILMAVGLIGAGILAIPILTGSAAYAVAQALGWPYGLDKKLGNAGLFYGVIACATLLGLLVNFVGINPMDALFWTAVINGFLASPLLVIIMLVANNRTVMRKRVNGHAMNILGWIITVIMFAAAMMLVFTWVYPS